MPWPKTHPFDILKTVDTYPVNQLKKQIDCISEPELREKVMEELESLGISLVGGQLKLSSIEKDYQRKIHGPARQIELEKANGWLQKKWKTYQKFFAQGEDIRPDQIQPRLVEVKTQRYLDLFRLARYTWSLPYTKGFGRRLQYLIIDESNQKLIGILGMQSPPLSFPARDRLFHYPSGKKTEIVNQMMDIYTLGAVPPYTRLLGGKLIALAAASNEVRAAYRRKYEGRHTEMEERCLPANLIALTTTSAYGRSSLYNRLKYKGELIARPIGFTEGYGAFHFERLYPLFRQFLEAQGISTKGGYGTGPRIKWQVIVRALHKLGFSNDLLRHGVLREVFLFPLISNLEDYVNGCDLKPTFLDLPFEELSNYWRDRWLLPRSNRVDGWHAWERKSLERVLFSTEALPVDPAVTCSSSHPSGG